MPVNSPTSFRAVITTLNSKYIHSSLGIWYLLAGIKCYAPDINACVIEGTVNEKMSDYSDRLICEKPDIIGFSCYIWNITCILEVIEQVKAALPKCVIVLGGPEADYNTAPLLDFADYILRGDGEKSFSALVSRIKNGGDIKDIDGICYKSDNEKIISPPAITSDNPCDPYLPEFFESLNGRIAYLETSRGCPYSCAFCLSGISKVCFFDEERAKNDIIRLANSCAKTIKLVDRTFNANARRAERLTRFIIGNYGDKIPLGTCFHFEIAGDILSDGLLDAYSKAPIGAVQLEIGLQSFNEQTLRAVRRKTDTDKLTKNIEKIISFGNIHLHIDLIVGLPHEDMSSFKDSFNTAFKLRPHMLQIGFLKLLHGSAMRQETQEYPCKYSSTPPYEIISTPWLSADEISDLHLFEDAFEHIYNSGRFTRTVSYLMEATGLTPFDLFDRVKCETLSPALDDYTNEIFEIFVEMAGVDKQILRDCMICDRLATNSSGVIPSVLKSPDDELKKIKRVLKTKSIRRTVAILYSSDEIVYTDYDSKNPVSGEYTLNYIGRNIYDK